MNIRIVEEVDRRLGRTFYRFYGTRGPRRIRLYFDAAHLGDRRITAEDAQYIERQTRIKRQYYMTLTQIRDAVTAVVGNEGEEVFSNAFIKCNSTSRRVRTGKQEAEIRTFNYPVFPAECPPRTIKMIIRKDGNGFILTKRDANRIIADEIKRRRDYIGVARVAENCSTSLHTVKDWARAAGEECISYRGTNYVKRGYGERLSVEKKAVELPKGARPLAPILRKMGITHSSATRRVVEEGGKYFFQYDTIEAGHKITRRIELYKTHESTYYITKEGRERLAADRQEEGRWLTTARMAEELGVTGETIDGYKKRGEGTYSLCIRRVEQSRMDNHVVRVDSPSMIIGNDRRINVDAVMRLLWSSESTVARMLGMRREELAKCRYPYTNVYKIPFERGQTIELPFAILQGNITISTRRLENARLWSENELADVLEIGITEIRTNIDAERQVYSVSNGHGKIELPYEIRDGEHRIDVSKLINATWPTEAQAAEQLGLGATYLQRRRVAVQWIYLLQLDVGSTEVEIPYVIVDDKIRLNPKALEKAKEALRELGE
jgi:hypothetical protein